MKEEEDGRLFTREDMNEAFNLGLEAGILALEAAEHLSPAGRRHLIKRLRRDLRRQSTGKEHKRLIHFHPMRSD